jgi:hypothetical protein
VEGNLRRRLIELRTDEGSGLAHESLSSAHMGRPSGGRNLHHYRLGRLSQHTGSSLDLLVVLSVSTRMQRARPQAGRRLPARPGWNQSC